MQQAGRAVMQLDRLQALEAGKAQRLLVVAVGPDADQLLIVIDSQHHAAMAHADAAGQGHGSWRLAHGVIAR
jgi:hypothetical protein